MAKNTCWRGHNYEGWSCPVCDLEAASEKQAQRAEEQTRRIEESNREAAERAAEAAREGAEALREQADRLEELEWSRQAAEAEAITGRRQLIEREHVIRAQARADQARRLLDGGLPEDALRQAREAIALDPECFQGYDVAIIVLSTRGESQEERELLYKQIISLRSPENVGNSRLHVCVLSRVRGDAELLDALLKVLAENARSFGTPLALRSVADALVAQDLREVVPPLIETNLSVRSSLVLHALLMEFNGASQQLLASFLGGFTRDTRRSLLNEFAALQTQASSLRISPLTLEKIRQAVIQRYEQWRPEIQQQLAESAKRKANASVSDTPVGIGCVGVPIALVAALAVMERVRLPPGTANRIPLPIVALLPALLLLASGFLGWLVVWALARALHWSVASAIGYHRRLREAELAESREWSTVFAPANAPRDCTAPSGL